MRDTYLGHEHKAEGGSRTEDDEHGDEDERGVFPVGQHNRDGGAHDAHNDNVVHAETNMLGIIERRYRDMSRLPGQESAEYLRAEIEGEKERRRINSVDGGRAGLNFGSLNSPEFVASWAAIKGDTSAAATVFC